MFNLNRFIVRPLRNHGFPSATWRLRLFQNNAKGMEANEDKIYESVLVSVTRPETYSALLMWVSPYTA
jgi:hypothetical protein